MNSNLVTESEEIKKSCLFTGHREIHASEKKELYAKVKKMIAELYAIGVRRFYAGGALGFDMIAGFAVTEMRSVYDGISLVLALPCKNHDSRWSEKDKLDIASLISSADEVVYVSEGYFTGCMLKRNRYMVERAEYCVSYLKKKTGGTAYTVGYAEKLGRTVVNL